MKWINSWLWKFATEFDLFLAMDGAWLGFFVQGERIQNEFFMFINVAGSCIREYSRQLFTSWCNILEACPQDVYKSYVKLKLEVEKLTYQVKLKLGLKS